MYWDLRDEPTREVRLRTSPRYAPEIQVGPDGTRPGGGGRLSILMPPGACTVRLNVGGKQLTQKLDVRRDPNSGATDADIKEQMKTLSELRRSLDAAADLVNQIEVVRGQIQTLGRVLQEAEIMTPAMELEGKLADLQQSMMDLRVTGRGQDGVRFGSQLLGKFSYLANGLASSDFPPTAQQLEVQKVLEDRLEAQRASLDRLLNSDLMALNDLMRGRGVANIVTPRKPGS